jgi:beta-mannosidase
VDPWISVDEAGTAAAALRSARRWSIDDSPRRFDGEDWWFRIRFDTAAPSPGHTLTFSGLASLAEVWLNGDRLLTSDNMFLAHRCAVPDLRARDNELLIRFASLDAWLVQRRPRPRWRTPMVEHQQLRWARSTLLGRVPGWAPPVAPVGPWRGVELVDQRSVCVSSLRLRTGLEGAHGKVALAIEMFPCDAPARLEIERAGTTLSAPLVSGHAALTVPDVSLWWPHTHGEPALYEARIVVDLQNHAEPILIELGHIGFRSVGLETAGGDFSLSINGVPVFCRGACWMPLDVVSLSSEPEACRAALQQARDAGMNMLRVSGATVYEEDHFYDLCDELGILVWQDFMFANMDYPFDNAEFIASVRAEVLQQLDRWQARPSIAVLCGNSEAEQQAAMWGSPRETWGQPAFDCLLRELVSDWCPDVPYWPSSAHGGAFPHQNDAGTTSYYGVGAYLRPLEDARRSGLRFATECLAFANVPPESTIARMPGGASVRVHHTAWKLRSPRDLGAGWDFDDVRDHYLRALYGVDPVTLRSSDHARYLALSRAVSAEVMCATVAEWRRSGSTCRGALTWFLRDLWAGPGWGLTDDRGVPKAALHGFRRACAPLAIFISDEGTNGLEIHIVNERDRQLGLFVEVALYRDDGLQLLRSEYPRAVAARSAVGANLAEWLPGFFDVSRAYRFGPAEHALVVATLKDGDGVEIGQAFHFPEGQPSRRERDIGMTARVHSEADGGAIVTVGTVRFAQSVHFELDGFVAEDEFFHLAPGSARQVRLTPLRSGAPPRLRGSVHALNAWSGASVSVPQS